MRGFFINISAFFIYLVVRLFGKLPDKLIIFIIDVLKPINRLFSKDDNPDASLNELREVFTDFPGGSMMVKSIIGESRPSQLKSTIRGMLRHHVFGDDRLYIDPDPLSKKLASKLKKKGRKVTVGFYSPEKEERNIGLPDNEMSSESSETCLETGVTEAVTDAKSATLHDNYAEQPERVVPHETAIEPETTAAHKAAKDSLTDIDPETPVTENQDIRQENIRLSTYEEGCRHDHKKLAEAYRCIPNVKTADLRARKGDAETLLDDIDVLEIADIKGRGGALALAALKQGIIVSLHYSCISSVKELQTLWDAAKSVRKRHLIRVVYPPIYFAPLQILKKLIERKELGELANIRVQAILGGEGGAIPVEKPGEKRFFANYAFNHFLLLSFLGGSLQNGMDYSSPVNHRNPMEAHKGGQAIASFKFREAGLYGMLECVHAPFMHIKSTHLPFAVSIEIAGTDGLCWANGGAGELSQAPPLWLRVGKRSYPVGVESGMPLHWDSVYEKIVAHTINMLNGKKYQIVEVPFVLDTLKRTEKLLAK